MFKILWQNPWRSPARFFFLLMALVSLLVMRPFWVRLLHPSASPAALLFLLPTFAFLYVALADWLNQTVVESDGNSLRVRRFPLPWPGGRHLPLAQLREFKRTQQVRLASGKTVTSYSVVAVLKDDREVSLVPRLSKPTAEALLANLRNSRLAR